MVNFARLPSPRAVLMTICSTVMAIALTACLGGGSSGSSATSGSTPSQTVPALGSIVISGRLNPATTTVNNTTASPDSITAGLDEVAISTDGNDYQTIFTGPSDEIFAGSDAVAPAMPTVDQIIAGKYKALRVTLDHLDWSADWGFSNLSPCDGATAGTASGSLKLNARPTYYFKTADLGGNTAQYYLANPPLTGYPGDADHPLVMPNAIQIVKDETTTLNLMINAARTLGCSRVSVFDRTATGDVAPNNEIGGTDTGLVGVGMLAVDTLRNQIAVASGVNNSIRVFDRGTSTTSPSSTPLRFLTGPTTLLNNPVGLAFYSAGKSDGSGDQYIVADKDNNSITTYTATDNDNAAPVRTITGPLIGTTGTGLDQPSGIALYYPNSTISTTDEILVANSGNDTITAYTRINFDNANPLWTIDETADGFTQATPCGIAVDNTNKKIYVANSGDDSIGVYNIANETSIGLDSVLQGASTGLSHPCGIAVDSTNNEVIVANTGNNTITVFDNNSASGTYAFGSTTTAAPNNIAPIRTISGPTTGLTKPVGVQVAGNELWVTGNGSSAEMLAMPSIMPVVSNATVANSNLNGNYNIVMYGLDLSKGVNGKGIQIPVLFAGRGSANFNSQATPWPNFALKLDTENRRQLMEPSCFTPHFQTKNGYYGMDTNHHFYAAFQDRKGIIDGSFLADGSAFNGTFYYGNEIFVIYGVKTTGSTVEYFTSDGSIHGLPAKYSIANYYDKIFKLVRPIVSLADHDSMRSELDVGMLDTDTTFFNALNAETNSVSTISPTDEAEPTGSTPPSYRTASAQQGAYTSHAGGQFENSSLSYGMAGGVSADSGIMLYMRDITSSALDVYNCPTTFGIGLGLKQQPANTYSVKDIKGTYFVSAFGNKYLNFNSRVKYMTASGSISFDGAGKATITLIDNSEGILSSDSTDYTYTVTARKLNPTATTMVDVVDIYGPNNTTDPYASATIGEDGRVLAFNLDIATYSDSRQGRASTNRLFGLALLQNP